MSKHYGIHATRVAEVVKGRRYKKSKKVKDEPEEPEESTSKPTEAEVFPELQDDNDWQPPAKKAKTEKKKKAPTKKGKGKKSAKAEETVSVPPAQPAEQPEVVAQEQGVSTRSAKTPRRVTVTKIQ